MEKVRYAEMLPHEIVARRKKFPAAFIGLGGLEWHGEHLAVGNDALKAEKLCELAAAKSGGFAMPTIWFGEPRSIGLMEADHNQDRKITDKMELCPSRFTTKHFGKGEDEQMDFYRRLIFHTLVQMNTLGMRAVCLVSGHYPLKQWADEAIKRFHRIRRHKDTRAYCGIEFHYTPSGGPENRVGGDHAAVWETSYLWYLRPDCVDMSVYLGRDDETLIGVGGQDPRGAASVERGRRACGIIVNNMVARARRLLKSSGWPKA